MIRVFLYLYLIMRTNYIFSFSTISIVFFFWGFIASTNGIFIPFCKNYFKLNQFQSQLVDFSFYGAYFFGSYTLYLFSFLIKKNFLDKWGYRKSIIYGLLLSAIGSFSMIFSLKLKSFNFILFSLFIVALGFSLQQISANPFVIKLGDNENASGRLNFSGGLNSLGTTIGPIIISIVLFGSINYTNYDYINFNKLMLMYLVIAILFTFSAVILSYIKDIKSNSNFENSPKALISLSIITFSILLIYAIIFNHYRINVVYNNFLILILLLLSFIIVIFVLNISYFLSRKNQNGWGAMKYPQLIFGMIAIFFYVGTEVSIQSNLGELLMKKNFGGFKESQISPFISMYWGSLMIGRWTAAINIFKLSNKFYNIFLCIVPLTAFLIIIFSNYITNNQVDNLFPYVSYIIFLIIGLYFSKNNPKLSLIIFSLFAFISVLMGLKFDGILSVYSFLSCGLFCSIMWPCIFTLSIKNIGDYASQGSSFLIMMILGGAIIPPIQGIIADILDIHISYFINLISFAYIGFYALLIRN